MIHSCIHQTTIDRDLEESREEQRIDKVTLTSTTPILSLVATRQQHIRLLPSGFLFVCKKIVVGGGGRVLLAPFCLLG